MSDKNEGSEKKPMLYNVKWVAHYLGVSRNTVHEWVNAKHIPYINLGIPGGRKVIRFSREAIDKWLLERTQGASPAESETDEKKES